MKRFLKIVGIVLAFEAAALLVNTATGTHLGSWVFGGAMVLWLAS